MEKGFLDPVGSFSVSNASVIGPTSRSRVASLWLFVFSACMVFDAHFLDTCPVNITELLPDRPSFMWISLTDAFCIANFPWVYIKLTPCVFEGVFKLAGGRKATQWMYLCQFSAIMQQEGCFTSAPELSYNSCPRGNVTSFCTSYAHCLSKLIQCECSLWATIIIMPLTQRILLPGFSSVGNLVGRSREPGWTALDLLTQTTATQTFWASAHLILLRFYEESCPWAHILFLSCPVLG